MTRYTCRSCREEWQQEDGKEVVYVGILCASCRKRLRRVKKQLVLKGKMGVQLTFTYHCVLCGEVTNGNALCHACEEECG